MKQKIKNDCFIFYDSLLGETMRGIFSDILTFNWSKESKNWSS